MNTPVLAIDEGTASVNAAVWIPDKDESFDFRLPCLETAIPADGQRYFHSPAFWQKLLALTGLPGPGPVLLSAEEAPPGAANGNLAAAAWYDGLFRRFGERGVPPDALVAPPFEAGLLRLSAIERMTGFFVLHRATAFILGMRALPVVAGRSGREGVVLLYMGRRCIRAALLYRDRLFALLELPAGNSRDDHTERAPDPQELMRFLEDLRLGWLPSEQALARGGTLCRAEVFPSEAEGFRPLFITGPGAATLEGRGRILDRGTGGNIHCGGLLAAFGTLQESQGA